MSDNLRGKVAVVTGGAVRVGRAIALALADAGCDLLIHYGRSQEPAQQTKADAEASGVRAVTHAADLADPAAVQGVIPAALEQLGRVDILVNSAAIFLEGNLAATSLEDWDKQFAINLRAPFLLSQALAQHTPADGEAQIINVTDARVFRPAPDHFAYRLTKSALVTMTETLALDLAPRIRVNAVALGAIMPPPGEDEAYLQKLAQEQVPLRRAGSAAIVADNVLHLARQRFVTGVTLKLDGGQFL
ncbi:MAG TPA: SDR family oxidoreductase [Candidatus Sulfomarinibacteraceae bacterium]|nr:SDR family oxidoreductase [Candidatus Sulfomarinibacteraceae bacterium]